MCIRTRTIDLVLNPSCLQHWFLPFCPNLLSLFVVSPGRHRDRAFLLCYYTLPYLPRACCRTLHLAVYHCTSLLVYVWLTAALTGYDQLSCEHMTSVAYFRPPEWYTAAIQCLGFLSITTPWSSPYENTDRGVLHLFLPSPGLFSIGARLGVLPT